MSDAPLPFAFTAARRYRSFDGGTSVETRCFAPDRYRFWDASVAKVGISRGAGFSYFYSTANILEVEAVVTLGQICQFATPLGLFMPVQPGHPKITVGGCIGADVHGKNQFRDGTFLAVVESLRLFHPSHG